MEEQQTMQIIIENDGLNGISNYEPLKAWALEQVAAYNGLIVAEDGIASAKTDCAKLRKIAKSASDYRISIKKEHEAKISKTLEQLKELTDIFNDAASSIDNQVKEFDEKRKEEKRSAIGKIYKDNIQDMEQFLPLQKIWNEKWMNKGYGLDAITKEIKAQVAAVEDGIKTIQLLGTKYESQMISAFLEAYNMNDALKKKAELEQIDSEMERRRTEMERRRKAQEEEQQNEEQVREQEEPQKQEEVPQEEPRYRLAFEVFGNHEQLTALVDYLRGSGLDYKRLG
jgi:hypothetical protein